jgi:drug/metabolite transporter (DMT)-like permease
VQRFGARLCFSEISLIPLKNHFKTRRNRRNFPLQADPDYPLSFVRLAVRVSGAQMLAGGVFLALTAAALGEFRNFHPWTVSHAAWLSLLYLIVAGSIIGFTAYVWLIHHESPTKVGTYAYVNPIVAVLVGYFLGGEALSLRTILGTLFVLISVVVITTTPAKKPIAALPVEDAAEVVGT